MTLPETALSILSRGCLLSDAVFRFKLRCMALEISQGGGDKTPCQPSRPASATNRERIKLNAKMLNARHQGDLSCARYAGSSGKRCSFARHSELVFDRVWLVDPGAVECAAGLHGFTCPGRVHRGTRLPLILCWSHLGGVAYVPVPPVRLC